jgi:hypothetical protein
MFSTTNSKFASSSCFGDDQLKDCYEVSKEWLTASINIQIADGVPLRDIQTLDNRWKLIILYGQQPSTPNKLWWCYGRSTTKEKRSSRKERVLMLSFLFLCLFLQKFWQQEGKIKCSMVVYLMANDSKNLDDGRDRTYPEDEWMQL